MAGILGLFVKVIRRFWGLGVYAWIFLRSVFLPRAGAAAKILALESQLEVCLRRSEMKRVGQVSDSFRFLWVILSNFWDGWERICHAMKPRTVVGWQEKVFQLFWRGKPRGEVGRKRISVELRRLIRRINRENPLWGATKIRDVLVELGFEELDVGTGRKSMPRRRHPRFLAKTVRTIGPEERSFPFPCREVYTIATKESLPRLEGDLVSAAKDWQKKADNETVSKRKRIPLKANGNRTRIQ